MFFRIYSVIQTSHIWLTKQLDAQATERNAGTALVGDRLKPSLTERLYVPDTYAVIVNVMTFLGWWTEKCMELVFVTDLGVLGIFFISTSRVSYLNSGTKYINITIRGNKFENR